MLVKSVLGLSLVFMLSACGKINDLMDMPGKMDKLIEKMDTTNDKINGTNVNMQGTIDALHKQVLLTALQELDKPANKENIFPIPTGLMPAGKAFAEEATGEEIMELLYSKMREIEEVNPLKGMDHDGAPLSLTQEQLQVLRADKLAKLYSLMIIATFAPDESDVAEDIRNQVVKPRHDVVSEIINSQINENGRYYDTAMAFFALRGYFLREVMLKLSLKVDASSAETLHTTGMMSDALKYLIKLDQISKVSFATKWPLRPEQIKVHLHEKEFNLLVFDEVQDLGTQRATAQIWQIALNKALAGMTDFGQQFSVSQKQSPIYLAQVQKQSSIANSMQAYINSWKLILP